MADTRVRDVTYDEEFRDELPANLRTGSVIQEKIDKIMANSPKWGRIASYGKPGGASAAANTLRQKYGDKSDVSGWEFQVMRDDAETDTPRTALWGKFDPGLVTTIGRQEFEKRVAARKAKAAERKSNKDKAEAAPKKAATPTK